MISARAWSQSDANPKHQKQQLLGGYGGSGSGGRASSTGGMARAAAAPAAQAPAGRPTFAGSSGGTCDAGSSSSSSAASAAASVSFPPPPAAAPPAAPDGKHANGARSRKQLVSSRFWVTGRGSKAHGRQTYRDSSATNKSSSSAARPVRATQLAKACGQAEHHQELSGRYNSSILTRRQHYKKSSCRIYMSFVLSIVNVD